MDKAIQIMVDFVEGNLSINQFQYEFFNNGLLKSKLRQKLNLPAYKSYNYNISDYLKNELQHTKGQWDNIDARSTVWYALKDWLKCNHIHFKEYTKYVEDYRLVLQLQPSWLDCVDDQGIFDKIIAEMPQDLSKTKRIQWGKNRIKELFRYDKTYPRWVQSPEWPIVNGKPLVFRGQIKERKGDERVYYTFYDPENGEETVVVQFY